MNGWLAVIAATLALFPQVPVSQSGDTGKSNWSVTQKIDPITDRKTGSAALISLDGKSRLSLACNGLLEPTISLQFKTSGFLGSTPNAVVIRIDQSILPGTAWDYQDSVAYTTDTDWLSLFQRMIDGGEHRIVVRALDYQNQPHDGIFISQNAAKAMTEVREMCAPPAPTVAH